MIFWMQTIFQKIICRETFNSKSNALFFFSIYNMTRCKASKSKSDALWKFCFKNTRVRKFYFPKSDLFWDFFSEIWFSSCFSGSHWMMISSVNNITKLLKKGELKDTACYRVSRQLYNCKVSHVNSSRHVWIMTTHNFTVVRDRTLWSIKCSRSAVFPK